MTGFSRSQAACLPPCPVPYQGSKRRLADEILACTPAMTTGKLWEPFAGSAAVTLAAAARSKAPQFVVSDCLGPLMDIWQLIVADPHPLAEGYQELWEQQKPDPYATYLRVRDGFNRTGDPVSLLYLIARCVKNAVRFNPRGQFNQSPDKRRLGMHPSKMRGQILAAHQLLRGRTRVLQADYREVLTEVRPEDVVYMDPPYQGVSYGRDKRYYRTLDLRSFVEQLKELNARGISCLVSFDGSSGERTYGQELPPELRLRRLHIQAGRSSQATLLGRNERTVESLYLSPALVERLGPATNVPTTCENAQLTLAIDA